MDAIKVKASTFLNSYYYPALIFFAVLIAHTFSIELFGIFVLLPTVGVGLIFCEDLKFLISPLIAFIFMFSQKSVASGVFYTTPYLVAIAIVSFLVLALFIAHFIIYKDKVDFKSLIRSKLFVGIACLCGAFLLNGLFNFDNYSWVNIFFALALIVCIGVVFFLFSINLTPSPELKKYLFYVLYLASILIVLEFYLSFIYQFEFKNGELVKESILFGWGIWNNLGGMLAFLLPVHFYYATTVKKYGWIFYCSGLLVYLTIVLSLSRSSFLISSIAIVACAIISCFSGTNKKINRIFTVVIAIIGILGIIILWDKISSVLGDYLSRGFDDNGRFEIYKKGLLSFTDNPIFGSGFSTADAQEHQFVAFMPDRYHNTVIQLLATCGIIGVIAYALHRFETVKLILKKRSIFSLFASVCLLCFLGTSLLDNHFFNMYPSFIYIAILVVIEKSESDYTKEI